MKQLLISAFLISLLSPMLAQEIKSPKPIPHQIFIGIDLLNPAIQFLSDKKGYEASVSVPVYKKWQAIAEGGYEENKYEQNSWNIDLSGFFARVGFDWYVDSDHKNLNNGYYLGARIGYSPYQLKINELPIKNQAGEVFSMPLGEVSSHALWVAPVVGARVNLGDTRFYVNSNVQLNILAMDLNEKDFDAFAIPGFGKSNNGLNLRVLWSFGFIL